MTLRVAYLTTHPIQYQVPVFRRLAEEGAFDFTVLFAHLPDARQQGDGFGVAFEWDQPLLEGYEYHVLRNVAAEPGVTTFRGCDTPDVGRVIRDLRLDAVIVNGWGTKSCLQGLAACRRQGIPCIVRGETNLNRPRAWWKRLIHRQLIHRYAACLTIGEANRAYYAAQGVPSARLFPSPYCVDNEWFEAAAARIDRGEARRRLGVPGGVPCFLFCGKFEPKKHPLELVRAFQAMRPGSREGAAHLLMVGDGPLRRACQACARADAADGARGGVTFTGFLNQSEIVAAYVAADCLVLPSDHDETWGLVVNEAMACGRGAVVSDAVGCAPDLIREGLTGVTFPAGGWDRLTAQMQQLAADIEVLRRMGRQAQRHIAAFSPEAAAHGIQQAVLSVGGGQRSVVSGSVVSGQESEARMSASHS